MLWESRASTLRRSVAARIGRFTPAGHALARTARATALHNNCSASMRRLLCTACALDADRERYIKPTHPVQRGEGRAGQPGGAAIAADACGLTAARSRRGGTARWLGAGVRELRHRVAAGAGTRRKAVARLRAACAAQSLARRGLGAVRTEIMQRPRRPRVRQDRRRGRLLRGAAGAGPGIAIKCDDGAGRAAEVMLAAVLARLLPGDRATLEPFVRPSLRNWNGLAVGGLRPTEAL